MILLFNALSHFLVDAVCLATLFGAVLILNALTFWKSVLPAYTRSFQRSEERRDG